jgi:hypothetical protein
MSVNTLHKEDNVILIIPLIQVTIVLRQGYVPEKRRTNPTQNPI